MNTPGIKSLPIFGTFLVLLFAGCATTGGLERSEQMTSSMESVEEDINLTLEEVNAVERSLNDLIRPGQGNVEEVYSEYSESVDELEEYGNSCITELDDMNSYASTYFSEWRAANQECESQRLPQWSGALRSGAQADSAD